MKKILTIIFILSLTTCYVYAGELQKQYEIQHGGKAFPDKIDYIYLLDEDYKTYSNGNGDSLFGLIKNDYNDINLSNISSRELNVKYLQQVINNIENAVNNDVTPKYIDVADDEFIKLDDRTKRDIAIHNNFAEKPQLQLPINTKPVAKQKTKGEKFLKGMKDFSLGIVSYNDPSKELEQMRIERDKQEQARLQKLKTEVDNAQAIALNTARMKLTDPVLHYAGKVYILGNASKRENSINLIDYVNDRNVQAEKLYSNYKTNPNDIKNNEKYIETIGTSKGIFTALYNGLKDDYIDTAYEIYEGSFNRQMLDIIKKQYQQKYAGITTGTMHLSYAEEIRKLEKECNNAKLMDKEEFISSVNKDGSLQIFSMQEKLSNLMQEYDSKAEEVSEYSYNYEKKKYNDWAVKNNKKQIKGALEQFVYASHYQPQSGLYTHNPRKNFYLKVFQTVPGGVILTGSYSIGTSSVNNIFLQTSKQFADGQIIAEPIIAEFKGYYDYTTVLGAKKRIYKFYRYGQNEIKSTFNIPGQPFYFYKPY